MRRLYLILWFTFLVASLYSQKNILADSAKKENKTKSLRFTVFGDWGRNGEDNQKETANELGIVSRTFKPSFIVSTGDNFYPSGVRSTRDYTWLASYEQIYTAHSLQTDWYVVLGNHDYKGNVQAEIDYSDIDRRWNMPARYYSKTVFIGGDSSQGVLLIFIDSTRT
jgi:3',5'-cyclic AMP phosphodiesterase CpdA